MSEDRDGDKKKRKRQQPTLVKEEQAQVEVTEEAKLQAVMTDLDEQKKKGKFVDIELCPNCKSPRLRRVGTIKGDMSGQMAMTLPKYECLDCGWRGRLTIFATNRPVDKKMMAVISESEEKANEEEYR